MITLDEITGLWDATRATRIATAEFTNNRIGRNIVVHDRRPRAVRERGVPLAVPFDIDDEALLEVYQFEFGLLIGGQRATTNAVWVMYSPRRRRPFVKPGCAPLEPIDATLRRRTRYFGVHNRSDRGEGWRIILEHCAAYEWSPR